MSLDPFYYIDHSLKIVDSHSEQISGKLQLFSYFMQIRFIPCLNVLAPEFIFGIRVKRRKENHNSGPNLNIHVCILKKKSVLILEKEKKTNTVRGVLCMNILNCHWLAGGRKSSLELYQELISVSRNGLLFWLKFAN